MKWSFLSDPHVVSFLWEIWWENRHLKVVKETALTFIWQSCQQSLISVHLHTHKQVSNRYLAAVYNKHIYLLSFQYMYIAILKLNLIQSLFPSGLYFLIWYTQRLKFAIMKVSYNNEPCHEKTCLWGVNLTSSLHHTKQSHFSLDEAVTRPVWGGGKPGHISSSTGICPVKPYIPTDFSGQSYALVVYSSIRYGPSN